MYIVLYDNDLKIPLLTRILKTPKPLVLTYDHETACVIDPWINGRCSQTILGGLSKRKKKSNKY